MHLSEMVESAKRAISPGRRGHSPGSGKKFRNWAGDDSVYLTYHDSRITRNDMSTLADPDGWLEDNAIQFWMQYLEHEELLDFPKAKIEFFAPSVASLLKLDERDMCRSMLRQIPDLAENRTTHIFAPVCNDRKDEHDHDLELRALRGSHWSLLVVSLIDNVAFHYDSLAGSNKGDAMTLLAGIEAALPVHRSLRFVEMKDSPQQVDGSNCGIFVLVIMKHLLLKRLLRADANQKITMSMRDQDIDYEGARRMICTLIEDRRNEALQQKSTTSEGVPMIISRTADRSNSDAHKAGKTKSAKRASSS